MTALYARLLNLITILARSVPRGFASFFDGLALDMVRLSRHLPPMPRQKLAMGVPFIGSIVCEDLDCRAENTLFLPLGADPDVDLACPKCQNQTGVIV